MTDHTNKHFIRAGFTWALVAALIVRSLIPIGYMPDFSKPGTSLPSVTPCNGMGPDHMMMTGMAEPHTGPTQPAHDDAPGKKHDAPCPFSVNAAFSFAGVQSAVLAVLIIFLAALLIPAALDLAPQRVYGNASSRSPPTSPA